MIHVVIHFDSSWDTELLGLARGSPIGAEKACGQKCQAPSRAAGLGFRSLGVLGLGFRVLGFRV